MILDIPQLLAPIPGERPTGSDLRLHPVHSQLYYQMKDARSTARAAERAADSETEQASRPAEWRLLIDMAQDALTLRTKDLEIAAWLIEAALRLHGFAGLRDGFALMDGLVERYWDDVFSVDTETVADKVAPLAGLNGVNQDGTLIQPIRLSPITAPGDGAGLWVFLAARRGGPGAAEAQRQVEQALRATDSATFVAVVHDVRSAIAAFTTLTRRLDALCGQDSPPSANISNVLNEALDMVLEIAGPALAAIPSAEPEAEAAAPAAAVAAAPAAAGPDAAPAPARVFQDREDALRQLGRIAQFFQEAEPNSPTGYVLETLVRRARLPLAELMRELVPDDTARQALLTVAGIGSPPRPDG